MTSYQEAYEKMSLSSVSFLITNAPITGTLTGFANYFNAIQAANTQIMTAKVQQEADRKGDTMSKNSIRENLIYQAMDVNRRVIALATNTNNSSLLELVNYSESQLKKSSDQKLASCCQVIRDNANANLSALSSYGVNATILNALQTSITNLNVAIPKARVVVSNSGEATQILANLFKSLSTNWAKIDTLIEMLRNSNPNFYDEYNRVRKVIVTGTSSLALKISVVDAISGEAQPYVTVSLTPSNEQFKSTINSIKNNIVKKTAKGGGIHIKNLPDGTYIYTAKKSGFIDESGSISIVNGEMTVLNIKIAKS